GPDHDARARRLDPARRAARGQLVRPRARPVRVRAGRRLRAAARPVARLAVEPADRGAAAPAGRAPADGLQRRHTLRLFDLLITELQLCDEVRLSLPMPRDRQLRELAASLLDQPEDGRGIEAWARRLNMSSRTLMRRFRGETGVTLGQWRQQARLLRAQEMLAVGKPVTEVALAVGYESTSAFIGSFRAAFGVTPSQYFGRH